MNTFNPAVQVIMQLLDLIVTLLFTIHTISYPEISYGRPIQLPKIVKMLPFKIKRMEILIFISITKLYRANLINKF